MNHCFQSFGKKITLPTLEPVLQADTVCVALRLPWKRSRLYRQVSRLQDENPHPTKSCIHPPCPRIVWILWARFLLVVCSDTCQYECSCTPVAGQKEIHWSIHHKKWVIYQASMYPVTNLAFQSGGFLTCRVHSARGLVNFSWICVLTI